MKKTSTIGIIGQGFVGSAVYEGLKEHYHIQTFDINLEFKFPCKFNTSAIEGSLYGASLTCNVPCISLIHCIKFIGILSSFLTIRSNGGPITNDSYFV